MATINASSMQDVQYSGDCPLAPAHGIITLAAQPSGDKVRMYKLFAGTKVHDLRLIFAALGASTTISVGFEYVNGEAGGGATALLAATSTSSAGQARMALAPVVLQFDAYITLTIGGAAATGQIDLLTMFEFRGK